MPPLRVWWREFAVLAISIMIEFCFVYYAATFLHDELDLSTAAAAAGAGAWGVGMAVGRFALCTWPPPRSALPSVIGVAIGFVLLWGVPNAGVAIAGIAIAGLGAAPLYPSRLTALLDRFPASPHEGSARGSLASGTALTAAPALMAGLRVIANVRVADPGGADPGGAAPAARQPLQPRPTKGIPAAITVIVSTLASGGRLAMYATARPTSATSIEGSSRIEPSAWATPDAIRAVIAVAAFPCRSART